MTLSVTSLAAAAAIALTTASAADALDVLVGGKA